MNDFKNDILNKICFTDLVYGRINKKLNTEFTRLEIEEMLKNILLETEEQNFIKIGKNIYVTNSHNNIKITINFNTKRIITVDKLFKNQQNPQPQE